jgi:TonB family protein
MSYAVAMTLTTPAVCLALALQAAAPRQPPPQRVTVEWLKSLKATSNDPSGDGFIGSRDQLSQSIDAIVTDSSLVSPAYLFIAARTAVTLNRVEDAAFLFYAGQLRAAFDFDRYDVDRQPNGNNAATYLGFLRETIGTSVNPAIMREPARFTAALNRLDRWELVPSRQAFYPEFESAKGFKTAPGTWAASAAAIKDQFMTRFGRRQARLLNDPEYFAAFRFVQGMNLGELPATAANRAELLKRSAAMAAAERRLFPPTASAPPAESASQPLRSGPESSTAVRVGPNVPEPKLLRRIEPEFPSGARGAVIMDVTIGPEGRVIDVRILRNEPALDAAAEKAVRQWIFAPTLIDGRPTAVIHTVSLTAR